MSFLSTLGLLQTDEAVTSNDVRSDGEALRAALSLLPDNRFAIKFNRRTGSNDGCGDVAIQVNGEHWAILPAEADNGPDFKWRTICSLPQRATATHMVVECSDLASSEQLISQEIKSPPFLVNSHGLAAIEVFDVTANAMFSAPWFEFDGAVITVSGAHLPPFGDPSRLSVEFGEGVVGTLEYPLPSPDFASHYWYWPNAHFSGFRVKINLPASRAGSSAFTFRFVTSTGKELSPFATSRPGAWKDRSRIWVPFDLNASLEYPPDGTQLSRVQTWSNQQTVTFTGYNAFKAFESLAAHYGVMPKYGMRMLDWGCGHGRVARHFISNWPQVHVSGTDIDSENIAWCQKHLPGGDFHVAPLWPAMDVPSNTYDFIVGLSVMTHLTAAAQDAWLAELNRVLKPGGLALITFGGYGAAAFASVHHSAEWWHKWVKSGFDDALPDPALDGKISDAGYYRVTHQTAARTRAAWSRVMTVEGIEAQAFGYQDVAILRAR